MSLRGYFAAKAMLALLTHHGGYTGTKRAIVYSMPARGRADVDSLAQYAYSRADAMLAEENDHRHNKLRELAQRHTKARGKLTREAAIISGHPDCNIMVQCLGDKSNVSTMASFPWSPAPSTVLALLDELEKRTLRADIPRGNGHRAQHHVIFSRELDKGM